MSAAVLFTVYGDPKPKGSMRAFLPKGHDRPIVTANNATPLKAWAQQVSASAIEARARDGFDLIDDGPVRVEVVFYLACPKSKPKRRPVYPTSKPDLDKLSRTILDACTGVLYRDDAQVTTMHVRKVYAGREQDAEGLLATRADVLVQRDRDEETGVLHGLMRRRPGARPGNSSMERNQDLDMPESSRPVTESGPPRHHPSLPTR